MNPIPEHNPQLVQRNLDYRIQQLREEIQQTEQSIDLQIDYLRQRKSTLEAFLKVYESLKQPD